MERERTIGKILVVDNYDSFTWNLVDLLRRGPMEVEVRRNDAVTVGEVREMAPDGILISPGPGRPSDSGVSTEIVRSFMGKVPILGVCLGHQLLGELFGMRLVHARAPMHGMTSLISHDGNGLFKGVPNPIRAMRYHSLLLDNTSPPRDVMITAATESGEVMGIRHKIFNFAGVQFHPESVLTEHGERMIGNWIQSLLEQKQKPVDRIYKK